MPALLKFSFFRYIAVSSIPAWATQDASQKKKNVKKKKELEKDWLT